MEVSPDALTIDAGTTRKVEGFFGAAFGGFEIKNLRTARIRLKNTYFGALHMNGPNIHTHLYYPTSRLFAGFMVDYHTTAGYSKRVALSVGVVHPDCSTPFPGYGKEGKPDQLVDLGPIVLQGAEKEFDLDLSQYAPEGWDGQVWFSVGSDWALPARRLNAQILSANQAPAGNRPDGGQEGVPVEEGKRWIAEVAIPFKGLGKTPAPGDTWALNLCRFRPEGSGFSLEFITWAPTEQGFGGDEMARFGTMTFK